jgi:two-component system sensor histidine kinase KdpD
LKYSYLQNFRALDAEAFAALMRHLGFASAACFRLSGEALVQVLSTEEGVGWPAAVGFPSNYTTVLMGTVPCGWVRLAQLPIARKGWPKGTTFYFPDQELYDERVVFAVQNPPGKRSRAGELSGPLEAAAARIRSWFKEQNERQELSEAGIREHIQRLGVDLQMLIDHELRTPMASVSGYASLLRETDQAEAPELWREYWQVLETQTGMALEAIEKLSLALSSNRRLDPAAAMERFDAAEEARAACDRLKERAVELVGEEQAKRLKLQFQKATDQSCVIRADRGLFAWALWEVLKNAAAHARTGKVTVAVYASDKVLVIDIEDDGSGVSPGAEELIFLRFYQDPATQHLRRGKRGLGLGLFLARHIVERHLGRLTFIRQRSASLFRFVWPLPEAAAQDGPDEAGKDSGASVIKLRGA